MCCLALLMILLPAASHAACSRSDTYQLVVTYSGEEEKAESIRVTVAGIHRRAIETLEKAKLGTPVLRSFRYTVDGKVQAASKEEKTATRGYGYKGRATFDVNAKADEAALLKALDEQQLRGTLAHAASTGKGCANLSKGL